MLLGTKKLHKHVFSQTVPQYVLKRVDKASIHVNATSQHIGLQAEGKVTRICRLAKIAKTTSKEKHPDCHRFKILCGH